MIPKRIIYTWFGKGPYPEGFSNIKKSWKEKNPDYEIIEINESNFNVEFCDFTKEAYLQGEMAFVSDVARIWAVNKLGGIYLDTDVECLKSFRGLENNHQFWAKEDVGFVASGLIFGSEKKDKILDEILDKYKIIKFDKANLEAITTVKIVSSIFKKYGLTNTTKTDRLHNGVIIYAPEYFAPIHYWGGGRVTSKSITVHHYEASWTKHKASLFKYIVHEFMFHFSYGGVFLRWLKKSIQKSL